MGNRLTIELPDKLYQRLEERAKNKNRPLEEEVAEVVAKAVPEEEALPLELKEAIAGLETLNDKALWRAARSRMLVKDSNKIEKLHLKRQDTGLNQDEEKLLANLMLEYRKTVLVKAKATAILLQRGYDVSGLVYPEA